MLPVLFVAVYEMVVNAQRRLFPSWKHNPHKEKAVFGVLLGAVLISILTAALCWSFVWRPLLVGLNILKAHEHDTIVGADGSDGIISDKEGDF